MRVSCIQMNHAGQKKRKKCLGRICHLARLFVTWFLELFVKDPPRLCDPLQTLLHGLDIHVGTVTLGELGVAVAPAVVILAVEFAFAIAGDVAESSAHKILPQVVWQDQLQACELESGCGWRYAAQTGLMQNSHWRQNISESFESSFFFVLMGSFILQRFPINLWPWYLNNLPTISVLCLGIRNFQSWQHNNRLASFVLE